MSKVKVYYFKQFDIKSGQFENSKSMATLERIGALRGAEPFMESEKEVNESDLDHDGHYRPD